MPIFVIFLIFFGVTWIITPVNFVVIYLRRKRARILAIKQRTAAAGAGMNLRRVGGEDGSLSEALMPRQLTAGAKCMFQVICIFVVIYTVRIKKDARWASIASFSAMILMFVIAVFNFTALVSALAAQAHPPEIV